MKTLIFITRVCAFLILLPVCAMAQLQTWAFSGTSAEPFVHVEGGYQDNSAFLDYKDGILGLVNDGDLFEGTLLVADDFEGSGNTAIYGVLVEWASGAVISGGSVTDTGTILDVQAGLPFYLTSIGSDLPGVENRTGDFFLESDEFSFQYWSDLMIDDLFVQTIVSFTGTIDEFDTTSAVPAPASFLLLSSGCLALARIRRKQSA